MASSFQASARLPPAPACLPVPIKRKAEFYDGELARVEDTLARVDAAIAKSCDVKKVKRMCRMMEELADEARGVAAELEAVDEQVAAWQADEAAKAAQWDAYNAAHGIVYEIPPPPGSE